MFFTIAFGIEAVLKILAFTFRGYIATATNKVQGKGLRQATCMTCSRPRCAGVRFPRLPKNEAESTPPTRDPQVDLLIVVTSAVLLALENAGMEAIKVGSGHQQYGAGEHSPCTETQAGDACPARQPECVTTISARRRLCAC